MSEPIFDIDEKEYEMYLADLRALSEDNNGVKLHASLSDFMVWRQEQGLDQGEV
jgi:hypothetical protein